MNEVERQDFIANLEGLCRVMTFVSLTNMPAQNRAILLSGIKARYKELCDYYRVKQEQ